MTATTGEVHDDLLGYVTQTIVEHFYPKGIVLSGSHARGDADAESDFDLFVEMDTALKPPERAIEISSIFGLRPWSLDLIVYTPDEVARLQRHGTLLAQIESEGKVLYERA